MKIGGSLALVVGDKTRGAALAFGLFPLLTVVFFHRFWAMPAEQRMTEYLMFMKKLYIAGGMFVLSAFDPGRLSLDGRSQ